MVQLLNDNDVYKDVLRVFVLYYEEKMRRSGPSGGAQGDSF